MTTARTRQACPAYKLHLFVDDIGGSDVPFPSAASAADVELEHSASHVLRVCPTSLPALPL